MEGHSKVVAQQFSKPGPAIKTYREFTGFFHLAGPYCPEVSVRTYCCLNLDRPSVGGAWAEDSQYFYSAYMAAIGTNPCSVHGTEGTQPGGQEGGEEPGGPDGSGSPDGSGGQAEEQPGEPEAPEADDPGAAGSSSLPGGEVPPEAA